MPVNTLIYTDFSGAINVHMGVCNILRWWNYFEGVYEKHLLRIYVDITKTVLALQLTADMLMHVYISIKFVWVSNLLLNIFRNHKVCLLSYFAIKFKFNLKCKLVLSVLVHHTIRMNFALEIRNSQSQNASQYRTEIRYMGTFTDLNIELMLISY